MAGFLLPLWELGFCSQLLYMALTRHWPLWVCRYLVEGSYLSASQILKKMFNTKQVLEMLAIVLVVLFAIFIVGFQQSTVDFALGSSLFFNANDSHCPMLE